VSLHLFRERVFLLSGMFLALSVHFKIYPIIYSLPMYASLTDRKGLTGLLFDINQARFVDSIIYLGWFNIFWSKSLWLVDI
jgi:Mannosyltransferase (PIG-M)